MRAAVFGLATSVAGLLLLTDPTVARACGCLSPPAVSEGEFAVNQQSEQIIFEVEPGWVTAHVMIKYAGDPATFAWIVPVPEVPELGVSPATAFGLLDSETKPDVAVTVEDICPQSQWTCAYHNQPSCGGGWGGDDEGGISSSADAGFSNDAGTASGSPVNVISEQVVGDYQTVTFRANEAAAATQWLRDNGFIVNQTTSIYMETYVQQNMVFVAAKLIPGAGVKAIKPLKLRYRSAYPMVPLILTAVASEPHLTVTSFIYSHELYRPLGHPVVTIDDKRIARDSKGRDNYPMVLARTIDEAGGDGFAIEYRGYGVVPDLNRSNMCCDTWNGYDQCGISNNDQCECPTMEFDSADCQALAPDLIESSYFLEALSAKYPRLTRITTRVSAEEMTFDPQFEPDFDALQTGRLFVRGKQPSLAQCSSDVLEPKAYARLSAEQSCASTYCGAGGSCVVTNTGPACACETNFVAQRFTDLDGSPSVTCVPRVPPVDLRANGEQLPDACAGKSCGLGSCVDRNGVAVCECSPGAAAVSGGSLPRCETIVVETSTPGAEDYSEGLRDLDVCSPPPPSCGASGWLVKDPNARPGVSCGNTEPPVWRTWPTDAPTCGSFDWAGCGCSAPGAPPASLLFAFGLVGFVVLRRRPRGQGR